MFPRNNDNGLSLIPAVIVAVGPAEQPVERLIGLQSAIARAVDWLARIRLPRIRSATRAAPPTLNVYPTSYGDLP